MNAAAISRFVVVAVMKKVAFAILCATLLVLVAASASATTPDPCNSPTVGGVPAGSFPNDPDGSCGVLIEVTGTSANTLAATISAGTSGAYDDVEDRLVGMKNSSTVTVGAIVLSATVNGEQIFGFDGDGPCSFHHYLWCPPSYVDPIGYEGPDNTFVGLSSDGKTGKVLFRTPLGPGQTTWFALENAPPIGTSAVVAIGEAQTLTSSQTSTFKFGSGGFDDYQITPLSTLTGTDTMTITPIPVPSGNFQAPFFTSTLYQCVPYYDYSTTGHPTCVEVERDCSGPDCSTFLYSATLDFNIDTSVGNIGGAAFLGQVGAACPTTGFNINITTSYTGSLVGTNDPLKGGSKGGGSCYVAAWDPTAPTVLPKCYCLDLLWL